MEWFRWKFEISERKKLWILFRNGDSSTFWAYSTSCYISSWMFHLTFSIPRLRLRFRVFFFLVACFSTLYWYFLSNVRIAYLCYTYVQVIFPLILDIPFYYLGLTKFSIVFINYLSFRQFVFCMICFCLIIIIIF